MRRVREGESRDGRGGGMQTRQTPAADSVIASSTTLLAPYYEYDYKCHHHWIRLLGRIIPIESLLDSLNRDETLLADQHRGEELACNRSSENQVPLKPKTKDKQWYDTTPH